MVVVSTPWHIPHQSHLASMPWVTRYDMVRTPWRVWNTKIRPIPIKMRFVTEVAPDVQLAILHIDQDTPYDVRKRITLLDMIAATAHVPKRVIINHGVPVSDHASDDQCREAVLALVGDIPMITNSKQAQEMWGTGTCIHHGYEKSYTERYKLPRVVMCISNFGMEKMYNRQLAEDVCSRMLAHGHEVRWIGKSVPIFDSFTTYKTYLTRSLIYLHLSEQSPMPRARTEAMNVGCHVVTVRGHDFDKIFQNITIVEPDAEDIVNTLIKLLANPNETAMIGEKGANECASYLSWDTYVQKWQAIINTL